MDYDTKCTRPFIKWAGGKRWLTKSISNLIPEKFGNYHEPFLGGGALYFSIKPAKTAFLSDINKDLINTYLQIKSNPELILDIIDTFKNSEIDYYNLRDSKSDDDIFNAAKFIFINKICYNGMFRVNSKGVFNVPYGHNQNVNIYNRESILSDHKLLKNSVLQVMDFEDSLIYINAHDLVILDPPYTVAHKNNGFIEYNQKLFSWDDQERLADFINLIKQKNAYYVLTNAAHDSIENLFSKLGKKIEINRSSTITSKIENRKIISEFIFTNCI